MAIFPSIIAGRPNSAATSIGVAGGTGVTLTTDQSVPSTITFSGALTGSITVTIPAASGDAGVEWTLINATSGAYTLAVGAATGTTVTLAQGCSCRIRWDGTNMKPVNSDVSLLGAAAKGANSDITSLSAITGGITASGGLNVDVIQGNGGAHAFGVLTKNFSSDANLTLSGAEAAHPYLIMTDTGVVLTTGRNVVLPLTAGAVYYVTNSTAQTLTFKGSSGTGIAVATTKRRIVACDGTNIVALTSADA